MCGIVGYIGGQNSVPVLINGLESLEYRGYDSAGVAVRDMSAELKRTRASIRARLEKLGLTNVEIGHGVP